MCIKEEASGQLTVIYVVMLCSLAPRLPKVKDNT